MSTLVDFKILDTKYKQVAVIDKYESIIWTDRYNSAGDFEIFLPVETGLLKSCLKNYYVWNSISEHTMIIEEIEIDSSVEKGNKLAVRGRSLESILERRIVWDKVIFQDTPIQTAIQRLLNESIIHPSISDRKIDNFIYVPTEDERITEITISGEYEGTDLLEVITNICNENDVGFKIYFDENWNFNFTLYTGYDRTYDQSLNPYVIFSPKFENLVSSEYFDSYQNLKTVTLVVGEQYSSEEGSPYEGWEQADIPHKTVTVGGGRGIHRRELYTQASDITSQTDEEDEEGKPIHMPDWQYFELLRQRGNEELATYRVTEKFQGELEAVNTFQYGKDFYIGDIVQIQNEYEIQGIVRVMEVIQSHDTSGYSLYPTFESRNDYGVSDYEQFENLPSINGVELIENVTMEDLGKINITNDELTELIDTQYNNVFNT